MLQLTKEQKKLLSPETKEAYEKVLARYAELTAQLESEKIRVKSNGPLQSLKQLPSKLSLQQELQQQLIKHYQQYSRIEEDLITRQSNIANSFINLLTLPQSKGQAEEQKFKEQSESLWDYEKQLHYNQHQLIKPAQLFQQKLQHSKPVKKIIVYGRAGIGKSVLCQYLATQWANKNKQEMASIREQFQFVFWLKLRYLINDYPEKDRTITSDTILFEMIQRYCGIELSQAEFKAILQHQSKQVLFILDGYDEIASSLPQRTDLRDVLSKLYSLGHVLITSRPMTLQMIGNQPLGEVLELECIGFADEDVRSYIKQFMADGQQPERADRLLSFLEARPKIWSMVHIPINCLLICYLWASGKLKAELGYTLTNLYEEIVKQLLENRAKKFPLLKQLCKKQTQSKLKDLTLGNLVIQFLTELAYHGRQQNKVILTDIRARLEAFIEQYDVRCKRSKEEFVPLDPQDLLLACQQSGLLKSIQAKEIKILNALDQEHEFIHLSFQEYFAAAYCQQQLEQPTTKQAQQLIQQIIQDKYESHYQLTWWFVAGLLYKRCEADGATGLMHFFQALLAKPREEMGVTHLRLIAHCLDECQADKTIPLLAGLLKQQKEYLLHPKLLEINEYLKLLVNVITTCFFTSKYLTSGSFKLLQYKKIAGNIRDELARALAMRCDNAIKEFIPLLQDKEIHGYRRSELVQALAGRTDIASKDFIPLLRDKEIEANIRGELARVLAGRNDIAGKSFIPLLRDKEIEANIRGELAKALAGRNDIAGKGFIPLLRDKEIEANIRGELAKALAGRNDIVINKAAPITQDKTMEFIISFTATSEARSDIESKELISLLSDKEVEGNIRGELAVALSDRSDIESKEFIPLLRAKEIESTIKGELAVALAKHTDISTNQLLSLLKSTYLTIELAEELSQVLIERNDVSIEQFLSLAQDKAINRNTRKALAKVLVKQEDISITQLLNLLQDKAITCNNSEKLAVALVSRSNISTEQILFLLRDTAINGHLITCFVIELVWRSAIASEQLLSLLKNTTIDKDRKGELAIGLAYADSEVPIEQFLSLLEDKVIDNDIRGELTVCLARRSDMPTKQLFSFLYDMSISEYRRWMLAQALAERDDIASEQLFPLLTTIDGYKRGYLAVALAKRSDASIEQFLTLLQDTEIEEKIRGRLADVLERRNDITASAVSNLWQLLLKRFGWIYILFSWLFKKPALFLQLPNFTDKAWLPLLYIPFLHGHIFTRQLDERENGLFWQLSQQGQTIKLPCTTPTFFLDKAKEQSWPTSLYNASGYDSGYSEPAKLSTNSLTIKTPLSSALWVIHLARNKVNAPAMLVVEGIENNQHFIKGYHLVRDSSNSFSTIQELVDKQVDMHFQAQHKAYIGLSWLVTPDTAKQLIGEINKELGRFISYDSLSWAETKLRAVGIKPKGDWSNITIGESKVTVAEQRRQVVVNQQIDLGNLISSINFKQDAKTIFKNLAKQGLTWSMLKHSCLFAPDMTDEKRRQGRDFIYQLIGKREQLDQQYYKAAVRQLFPEGQYGHEIHADGDVRDDGTGFKIRYYRIRVFNEPVSFMSANNSSRPHASILIKAPGSRDLTSDIDTTLSVKEIDNIQLDRINLPENWSQADYDKELLVQSALIYYFNELNQRELQITSGESRDSNVYADGFINPRGYPKLDGRLTLTTEAFDLAFDDELRKIDKNTFFAEHKKVKQQQELAASLCSLREYFALTNNDWGVFKLSIIEEFSEQQEDKHAQEAFNKSIESAFSMADTYWRYKCQALKQKTRQAKYASILQDKASEKDTAVAAMNALYVEHLQELAKKYQAVSAKYDTINDNLSVLRDKLNELSEVKELKEDNETKKDKSERYKQQYVQSLKEFDDLNKEIAALRAKIKRDCKDLAQLVNEQQDAQIKANLFANEAYVNYSAPYHVVQWLQSQGEAKINKRQVVMGSVLQQIGFLLLHAEQLKEEKRPQGEILYSVSKYGLRVADMLFGSEDAYFGDKIFNEDELKTITDTQALVKRLGNVKTNFRYRELTIVNNYTQIAKEIKKNNEIKLDEKAPQTTLLVKSWIYKQNNPTQPHVSCNDANSITDQELITRLESDKNHWLAIVKKVILASYASKLEQTHQFWGGPTLKK